MRRFAPVLMPVMALRKPFRFSGIGVERAKEIGPAALGFVLWFSGAQRGGEISPERIKPAIRHLQYPADIGGLAFIEKFIGGGRVGIFAVGPLQKAERHQRVQKITRRSGMQSQPALQEFESSAPLASSVNTSISIALSRVLEAQNPRPTCMMASMLGSFILTLIRYLPEIKLDVSIWKFEASFS